MDTIEPPALDFTTPNVASFKQTNTILTFTILLTFLPITLRLYLDYLSYLSLGPGGTPATLQGFLKVKALGLFALRNPYEPRRCVVGDEPNPADCGYLRPRPEGLQRRKGERPEVKGIAPQR